MKREIEDEDESTGRESCSIINLASETRMLNICKGQCISTIAEVPVASKAIRVMSSGPLRGDEEEEDVDDPPSTASAAAKPTIRVRNNLIHSIGSTATTAGGGLNHILKMPDSLFARNLSASARPSVSEAEADVKRLSEEVRALQWLARRKEQEWDQVVRLLKQKEEKLLVAERAKVVAAAGESEIPTIINKVMPHRSAAAATAVPVIGNLVNGSEVAAKLPAAAAAGTIIINKQSGAVLANTATGAGHGRRILIPAGQITQAQLQAMKSSGKINANQFQSISEGKTVLAASAATTAPSDHHRPITVTSASGAVLSSKFAKIAPKPLNFRAPGPKIVTVQGSANVTTAAALTAAGVNPVLVSANGGSVLAKPAPQIRDSQTSQQVRPEEQEEQGKITMSSSSIPLCGFCRAKKSKFVCSYCKDKWYCSRKCQLDDWDGHEDECADSEG